MENSIGTVDEAAASNIMVACTDNTYSISGTLTGLNAGQTATLINGSDELTLDATYNNQSFTFSVEVPGQAEYNISVTDQPTGQTCAVQNSIGTVDEAAASNITVACIDNTYPIGGTLTGLNAGQTATLINGSDELTLDATYNNQSFTFSVEVPDQTEYNISVIDQPTGQTCAVQNSIGTVDEAAVSNIMVACNNNIIRDGMVELINPLEDVQLIDTTPVVIDLFQHFQNNEATGTVVKFETNSPVGSTDFFVELYDNAASAPTRTTPLTVQNFLSYVQADSYDGVMIHRSIADFVIQGGEFSAPTLPADQPGSDPVPIVTYTAVLNEPGNSNIRGTIAMGKTGGQPDSVTNQWFFNLADNSFLDSVNGGYTVFGQVVDTGMDVVDQMAQALTDDLQTYYSNEAFLDLPLWQVNNDNIVNPQDFVTIERIVELAAENLLSYNATASVPEAVTIVISESVLTLVPQDETTQQYTITLRATSIFDSSDYREITFEVTR